MHKTGKDIFFLFVVTVGIWLLYYLICWANKLGLFLRGSIFTVADPSDPIDMFVNNISSLGVIFVVMLVLTIAVTLDE